MLAIPIQIDRGELLSLPDDFGRCEHESGSKELRLLLCPPMLDQEAAAREGRIRVSIRAKVVVTIYVAPAMPPFAIVSRRPSNRHSQQGGRLSIPTLVERFYETIWNQGDLQAIADLLAKDFSFRGSLGTELRGHEAFQEYVCSVRTALDGYRCEILECVSEGSHAFAKMRFSGIHVADFRGYRPTGKTVHWMGAALFRFGDDVIVELWVLGDLASLDAMLEKNRKL